MKILLLILLSLSANAATYYIDYVGGADTNNGTSTATPWKRAPGMVGCANTCASTTPAAGDSFIFKGGVTWPNGVFGWLWTWSGNATTASPGCTGTGCIYIGVDKSWYTGASWARPILDAEGTATTTRDGIANHILRLYANYVIVDNLEFTGLYWTGVPSFGHSVNLQISGGTPGVGTNIEIKNIYIHGWSHNTYASGTREIPCGVVGDTGIPNNHTNSIIHDSVIDGSDTSKDSCSAIFGGPPYIVNNYLNWVSSGMIINGSVKVDGNTVTNIPASFDTSAHTNGIEINASQDAVVSNNVIANLGGGTLGLWVAPNVNYSTWVYNNLIYNTDTSNVVDPAPPVTNNGCANNGTYCTSSGSVYIWNNTVQCGPDSNPSAVCAAGIASSIAAVELKNNHWITNATTPNNGEWSTNGVTPTTATNLRQSASAATSAGYTSAQTSPFFPTAADGATVGTGTDLSASCAGALTALCSSTTLGVILNADKTVTARKTAIARGAAWDIGAYEYARETWPTTLGPGTWRINVK
jgi:hypothetical protein